MKDDTKLVQALRALGREREVADAAVNTIKALMVRKSWHLTCGVPGCAWKAELISGLDRSTAEVVGLAHQRGHEGEQRANRDGLEAIARLGCPEEIAKATVRHFRARGRSRGQCASEAVAAIYGRAIADGQEIHRNEIHAAVARAMAAEWPAAEPAHVHPQEAA